MLRKVDALSFIIHADAAMNAEEKTKEKLKRRRFHETVVWRIRSRRQSAARSLHVRRSRAMRKDVCKMLRRRYQS